MDTFTDRLKVLIGDQSANSIARRVGIGESLLRKYLNGTVPSIENAAKLADGLGVNLEWLATGQGPERKASSNLSGPRDQTALDRLTVVEERLRAAGDLRTAMARVDREMLELKTELYAIRHGTEDEFVRARADLILHLAFSDEGASARNQAREDSVFARMRESSQIVERVFGEVGWQPPLEIVEAIKLLVFSYGLTEPDAVDVLHLIKAGCARLAPLQIDAQRRGDVT